MNPTHIHKPTGKRCEVMPPQGQGRLMCNFGPVSSPFCYVDARDLEPLPTQPDPLTIAYIAMGAAEAIRERPGACLPTYICDEFGGQLGYIDTVISNALMLDQMAAGRDCGVFVYEVAEPFGLEYGRALLAGKDCQAEEIARRLIAEAG